MLLVAFRRGSSTTTRISSADRMIGDRRLMNAGERSLSGPSRYIPAGYMMTSIHCPKGSTLYGIVTDRKDFYHQAKVTRSRAESNCLPFAYDASCFDGDPALYCDLMTTSAACMDQERLLVIDMGSTSSLDVERVFWLELRRSTLPSSRSIRVTILELSLLCQVTLQCW